MAGSNMIGNLAVNLSMNTAAFTAGATKAEHRAKQLQGRMAGIGASMKGMGAGMVAGFGVAAISGMVGSAFELAASLKEAAEKMGVSVEGLQRLRVAARETGVSNEQLDNAMVKLNKSMGELQFGSAKATAAFERIGLTADELKGKKPDEALRMIADALMKIPDPQQRIAAGSAIMGKNFAQLIPMISGGSEALGKYAEQSKASGEVSTANAKKLDELSDRWAGFKVSLGVATANIIANVAGMYEKVNGWLKGLSDWAGRFDAAVVEMGRSVVAAVVGMVSGIGNAITGRLNAIWDGAVKRVNQVKESFRDLYDKVVGNSYVPDMIEGIAQSMSELGKIMVDPALSATQKVGHAFQSLGNLIGGIFGSKVGGIVSSIGNLALALAPLFGGSSLGQSIHPVVNGVDPLAPKMARGGSGRFGGIGGTDRNTLSLNGSPIARVSRGEHFTVTPANSNQSARVTIVPTPYFDAHVQGQAAQVAAPMASSAAVSGAAGAHQRLGQIQRRRYP